MFTGLPDCATARMKSVWRHRKAGVCSTSTTAATSAISSSVCTSVSTGTPSSRLHLGQDLQALVHARAAEAGAARAVGLVVAALEDEGDAERGGDLLQRAGDVHLQLLGLDHAGAGDQEEAAGPARRRSRRASCSDRLQRRLRFGALRPGARSAALMKRLNSGWPSQGVDLNSGWNCTPMNHGCTLLRQLDDLGQLLALRERRDHQAGLGAAGRGSCTLAS